MAIVAIAPAAAAQSLPPLPPPTRADTPAPHVSGEPRVVPRDVPAPPPDDTDAAPPAEPRAPPPPPPPAYGTATIPAPVVVHLTTTSSKVRLERKVLTGPTVNGRRAMSWEAVCNAPCDQPQDPRFVYRVIGPDLEASNEIDLGTRARADLIVEGSNPSVKTLGAVLGVTGLGAGYVSFLVLSTKSSSSSAQSDQRTGATVGLVAGLGLAAIGGALMFMVYKPTKVRLLDGTIVGAARGFRWEF